MSAHVGHLCKVQLGANAVVGVGNWTMNGVSTDKYDITQQGDTWKQKEYGLKDGGTITFDGWYDATDSTGQDALRTANEDNTSITDIRFYVDNTSYWIPRTTGPASYVKVTAWDVKTSLTDVIRCSFTVEVSGALELL